MAKVHIFIDGSWLFKACSKYGVLAQKFYRPEKFKVDFTRLQELIVRHILEKNEVCNAKELELGDCFNFMSILNLPEDFADWEGKKIGDVVVGKDNIKITSEEVKKRKEFAEASFEAGFEKKAVLEVDLKEWMLANLINGCFQEKKIDTMLVVTFIKYVLRKPKDYFAIVTGDADMLPAIEFANEGFTNNICLVITSPDENKKYISTAFGYTKYKFDTPTIYLQDHIKDIVAGSYIYTCASCSKVFKTKVEITRICEHNCTICLSKKKGIRKYDF